MLKFLLRTLITTAAFYTLLPLFSAFEFHGNILHALAVAAGTIFSCTVLYFVCDALDSAVTVRLAKAQVTTLKGLSVLVPIWLFSYILVPGLVLKVAAYFFPALLSLPTLGSIFCAGLILFLIGSFTGAYSRPPETCHSCTGEDPTPPGASPKS
jgi:hypothetical protein